MAESVEAALCAGPSDDPVVADTVAEAEGTQSGCGGGAGLEVPGSQLVNIQIGPQHFDLLKLIGEGAFGKVLLVRNRLDKKVYAMKVI
jgi:serine/threonine protein kinase